MPYKKPINYKTPKEVLESTPKIKKKEAIFTKGNGPFLEYEEISTKRRKHNVIYSENKLKNKLYHTHIQYQKKINSSAFPSIQDLTVFFLDRSLRDISYEAIFVIDEKTGKNIGRSVYTFTPKTDKVISNLLEKYNDMFSKKKSDSIIYNIFQNYDDLTIKKLLDPDPNSNQLLKKKILFKEILEDKHKNSSSIHDFYDFLINDLGIKIRFVPMPGYKFNKETFRFEKK
jgi:hypothetical protein